MSQMRVSDFDLFPRIDVELLAVTVHCFPFACLKAGATVALELGVKLKYSKIDHSFAPWLIDCSVLW